MRPRPIDIAGLPSGFRKRSLANQVGISVERLSEYEARPASESDVALHIRINQILDRCERRQKGRNDFWIISSFDSTGRCSKPSVFAAAGLRG